jgi:hypothetical protein
MIITGWWQLFFLSLCLTFIIDDRPEEW